MARRTLISNIQNQLESLYGICLTQRVEDYLINREEIFNYIPKKKNTKIPKELFLVRRKNGSLIEVALFLDSKLIQNLKENDPYASLNKKNLSDFCIMIEGVSHFVYFLWKTYNDRPITQLEMELQAEIDKFLMLFFYLRSAEEPVFQPEMFEILFEDFNTHKNLSGEAKERYLTASSLASRYCHSFQKRFKNSEDIKSIIDEIRQFYNFSQEQKIQHISH